VLHFCCISAAYAHRLRGAKDGENRRKYDCQSSAPVDLLLLAGLVILDAVNVLAAFADGTSGVARPPWQPSGR
jgi:hypothetical protein